MSRVLLIACVLLGLLLSGCATSQPATIVSRAAPPAPEPEPAADWIGAGAVVRSEVPQESPLPPPPPPQNAPPRKQTWTSKVAQKGKNTLRKTVRFTGDVILITVVVTGIAGLVLLYAAASANSSGHPLH